MSDSMAAYYDDLADYRFLCSLLNAEQKEDIYVHLEELKNDSRVEYVDYSYKLKKHVNKGKN